MNAAVRAVRDAGEASYPVGEILAAWRGAPDALLLLGWQSDRPIPQGVVAVQGPGERRTGRFTRLAWPAVVAGAEAYRFLAAVHLPGAELGGGDALLLMGRRACDDGVLARLPPFLLDAAAFGAELARAAPGGTAPPVARFLGDAFVPAAASAEPAAHGVLAGFLDRVSEPDGCVEVVGAIRERCAFLQGWGRPLDAACEVILAGAGLRRHAGRLAGFARPDIAAPATGQVLVLPAEAGEAQRGLWGVETVFLLGRDGVRRRPVLPDRVALSEKETAGHIRGVLPGLRCDAETRAALAQALRPVYAGKTTLCDAGHPVRLGLDLAVGGPGAGAYLTGWLYDPAGAVDGVLFRGTRGTAARLDADWTRIPRPDVTEAFRAEPGLPACEPGRHWHGFAVGVPAASGPAGGEACYLEVRFRDGWCGFVPLALAPVGSEAGRSRLLAGVDMHKPSGASVVERQLAPFLSGLPAPRPRPGGAASLPRGWTSPIVVPLPEAEPPRVLLSGFLNDPAARHEGVLFVCGDAWTEAGIAALGRMARFYGVPWASVRLDATPTPRVALEIAAEASGAERFLLLGPGTVGRTPGWRRALEDAARGAGGTACVSPTVLYEDDSIRFAGCEGVEPLDAEPYVRVRRRLAGLPAGFAPPGPAVPTAGVSATCCLVPRGAFDGLGAAPGAHSAVASWERELDLLLHLKHAGAAALWAPAVRVYAAEDPAPDGAPDYVGRLVARWCARARLAGGEK